MPTLPYRSPRRTFHGSAAAPLVEGRRAPMIKTLSSSYGNKGAFPGGVFSYLDVQAREAVVVYVPRAPVIPSLNDTAGHVGNIPYLTSAAM